MTRKVPEYPECPPPAATSGHPSPDQTPTVKPTPNGKGDMAGPSLERCRPSENLRGLLARRRVVLGAAIQLDCPWLVEMIAAAGFDYALLDGEHGMVLPRLAEMVLACDAAGIPSVVRLPSHDRGWLLQALEVGASAVQLPMVETLDQARDLVQQVKYAPLGRRGVSRATRAAGYGAVSSARLARQGNDTVMLILQLETAPAMAQAEQFAQIAGVDAVFIGPSDLAQSMGLGDDPEAPAVCQAVADGIRRLSPLTCVGVSSFDEPSTRRWQDAGARLLLTSTTPVLLDALRHQRHHVGGRVLSADEPHAHQGAPANAPCDAPPTRGTDRPTHTPDTTDPPEEPA